tara:strand:- start:81 stop:299 length:219 start_codon:yes stop_codon:yes gene_type:complete
VDACFCDDVEESQNNKREREREKKANKKEKKKQMETLASKATRRERTNRQVVKEFISVFEKFLHFFPSLRLM